jgi:cardiolipin synthase
VKANRILPNAITLVRLACVPAIVWLIMTAEMGPAFCLFVGAGVTDAMDGTVARLTHTQSALGSYLDALADKVLLVSIFVSLGGLGLLWGWLVGMVVCRDLLLVAFAAGMHLGGNQSLVRPLLVSKVNTFAQILLAAAVLGHQGPGLISAGLIAPLSWLVAGTTAISAGAYLLSWLGRTVDENRRSVRE